MFDPDTWGLDDASDGCSEDCTASTDTSDDDSAHSQKSPSVECANCARLQQELLHIKSRFGAAQLMRATWLILHACHEEIHTRLLVWRTEAAFTMALAPSTAAEQPSGLQPAADDALLSSSNPDTTLLSAAEEENCRLKACMRLMEADTDALRSENAELVRSSETFESRARQLEKQLGLMRVAHVMEHGVKVAVPNEPVDIESHKSRSGSPVIGRNRSPSRRILDAATAWKVGAPLAGRASSLERSKSPCRILR